MAASGTQNLSSLLQRATLEDHEDVLKAANNALKKSRGDIQAQQARLVALIKLDRNEDALRAVEDGGETLKARAQLEHAYVLYKTHRLEDAQAVVAKSTRSLGLEHLEAQIAYRAESFLQARKLYEKLAAQSHGEDGDIKINQSAIDAQLIWSGQGAAVKKLKPNREDLEQLDTTFNFACACIARHQYKEAEVYLRMAKDLCDASDDMSEEDKQLEVLPILVQQVYVLSRLGKGREAEELCSTIELDKITDDTTKHIAHINSYFAAAKPPNPYLMERQVRSKAFLSTSNPPFGYQRSPLSRNNMTLDLLTSKHASLQKVTTSGQPWAGVYRAATYAGKLNTKDALKELDPVLERNRTDLGVLFTVIQLCALTNNTEAAALYLQKSLYDLEQSSQPSHKDLRFAPGLVGLEVSLAMRQGRTAHTQARLAKACSYWRSRSKDERETHEALNRAGLAMLDSSSSTSLEKASELYESLHGDHPEDRVSGVGAVAALHSRSAPEDLPVETLPPTDELITQINAQNLEDAGIGEVPTPAITSNQARKRRAEPLSKPEKPKKRRKPRLPKDYDPKKKPDPERWLPLRERSNWRPKGKKKGKGGVGGSTMQGGVVSEDSRPATPSQQQQKASVPSKSKQKKGKGK
ncbi:MAG: Signal recognition particle core component [Chrysothrix sp. TS-e1954]|nr:MAG: Signal recognition particle core component [Chrysothrix sp. TS-e1954]